MRIAMIGSGYVGLVSGACFAQFGHDVICVDKDEGKIARLRKGEMPIYEPGLDKLVTDNMRAGRLAFGTGLGEAVGDADAVFIAVGTPTRRGDGHADLSYVYAAAAEIADAHPGLYRRRHQVDGAGRHRPRGRAHHPRAAAGGRVRRRVQSGIPARGCGDRGLHEARPGGDRRRERRARAT